MNLQTLLVILLLILGGCGPSSIDVDVSHIIIPDDHPSIGILLDSIYAEDQKYRGEVGKLIKKHGFESDEVQTLWSKMAKVDAGNVQIVKKILDKHGWLGTEQIGDNANSALFLVIQHSELATQQKYLPMTKQAVKDGKASPQALALLEDRVGLSTGYQVYGSQLGQNETGEWYIFPMREPEKVNERRASVGLGTIEELASSYGFEWSVEEYERRMPK